jgi:hypothetical protein
MEKLKNVSLKPAMEKNISSFANILQGKVINLGINAAYCGCNPTCNCEEKPGCCEGKCPCHTDTDFGSPESLVINPVFRDIVSRFDSNQIKTIEEFENLVTQIRANIAK